MKLEWSPENASKAYLDTVKSCELHQGSGEAELISAMSAGWTAKLIVETWSKDNLSQISTSIGLAIAARHTGGRHMCIVPDSCSRTAYIQAMSSTVPLPEIIVGDADDVIGELECIDFLVVDGGRRDFSRFLRLAKLSKRGAVLVCKNGSESRTVLGGVKWRAVIDGGRRVVRTTYLPVGEGLDVAYVAGLGSSGGKRRWVKHFDQVSGEEHVILRS